MDQPSIISGREPERWLVTGGRGVLNEQWAAYRTNITNRNLAVSPLLLLPGEIRNEIWKYVAMNTTVVIHGSRSGHVVVCTHNNRATKMTFSLPRVCRTIYTDTSMLLYQYAIFVYQQNWILYNCYDPKFKGRLIDRHELSSTQVDLISTVIPSPIYSVSHLNDFVKGLSHLHLSCGPRMETWLKYVKKKWDGKVEVHAHLDWHTDPVTQVLGTIIQDSDHDPWVKMMCARREDTSALRELKALFRCTLLESMKDELFGLQLAERYFRGKMAEAAEGLRDAGVSHVWLRKKLL